ncbi:MAG: hypothetical protein ACK52I_19205 [Pseudomonadota bacterium]
MMLTLHKRRRIAGTVTYTTANPPHAQSWRAANDEQEDDALRAARGIINALVIGAALWALLAVGVWALSFLWA